MRLYVASDLHIQSSDDRVLQALVDFVRTRLQPGDTLVLAGDVFDLFVGNKAVFKERFSVLLQALDEAGRRGITLHYIEGNHDFFLRGALRGIENLTVHTDGMALQLAGKRFYIAHGDTADRRDYGYRLLRLFFRSPLIRAFVAVAPGSWIDGIGGASSRHSRRNRGTFRRSNIEPLRVALRSYAAERLTEGYDYVILGHTHDLDEMKFHIGGRTGQYMNSGCPRLHGSLVSWSPEEPEMTREKL